MVAIIDCTQYWMNNNPPHVCAALYQGTPLVTGVKLCSAHIQNANTSVPPPASPAFEAGWEACQKVWSNWLTTEAARQQREIDDEPRRKAAIQKLMGPPPESPAATAQRQQFINDLAGKMK